jgi:hypothetical protein
MRKAYILKRLTGQVKRLAALMLITLMAVGNVFAQYQGTGTFTKINSQAELTTGYYVITDVNGTASMQNVQYSSSSTNYVQSTGVEIADNSIANPTADIVWLITVENGVITIYNEAEEVYFSGPTANKNQALLVSSVSDLTRWNTQISDDQWGGWMVTNVSNNREIRYNANSGQQRFACYTSDPNANMRRLAFYKMESGDAPVAVAAPTFSLPTGTYYTPQTVTLTAAADANVYYTINGGEPVLYNAPFTVNATSVITAYAVVGETTSPTSTVTLTFPVQLANIAAFYAAENGLYQITGDLTFVYRNGVNMYVQDATGGLLVYDNQGIITNEYDNGDVISGGIVGTRSVFRNLIELTPSMNTAEGVTGTAVAPVEVTLAQLLANPNDYMSKLVKVKNGQLGAGSFNTSSSTSVTYTEGENSIQVFNKFKTIEATFEEGTDAAVVGFFTVYNNDFQLLPRDANDIIPSYITLPYTCSFEDNYADIWQLANGATNQWYFGQAQGFDNNKLYISSSNGVTNKYNVNTAAVSHAYVKVNLPASDVLLSFDYRVMGDVNDYLMVSVMDEAPEAGVIPTGFLGTFYGINEFSNLNVLIPASNAGVKYLVFTWVNDNAGGMQAPAAIDNVTIESTCTQISNLAAAVNGQTAVITWNAPAGQNAWTLQYKAVGTDIWQTVEATEATVTLNNLATETDYVVRVKANCGDNGSAWTIAPFTVPCVNLTTSQQEITIGEGTSTTNIAPANAYYKNSWTQMVYPASEFSTPGYINSLSWYVNESLAHNYDYFKIYIGTKASAVNENSSDWLSMDDLTLVYESYNGTLGSEAGWETYTLSTPYYYNGEDNLVIVTARTAAAYNSVQYRYTSSSNTVLYRRSDSSPESYGVHPGTNTGTLSTNLPNMKIDFTGYVCGDEHCAAPANVTVDNITTNSAVLNWEAGNATSWQVSYMRAADVEWTTVNVTDNTYALTGLDQNTAYTVRVMADCGATGMSNEVALGFVTEATCQVPQDLTAEATTHTVHVSWLPVAGVSNYEVEVMNGNNTIINETVANASQTNISGLAEGEMYIISVRALCSEEDASDWNTITFTMPTICPPVNNVTVTDIEQNSATVTWIGGDETNWIVEYGYKGFNLGEGIQVMVDGNSAILTGLDVYTEYDVYVKADCGLGYTSIWSPKKSFMTECGILTITPAAPFFENFDTRYTGSGAQALKDCWTTPVTYTANNGTFPAAYNYADAAHSGSWSLEVKGDNGMFTLPEFSNDITTLQINFWANTTAADADAAGTMEVGVLNDLDDPTSFVVVSEVELSAFGRDNTRQYGPYSFENVTPVAGQRIAIRYANTDVTPSWNFDDFTVELIPDCQTPSDVAASDLTPYTAKISWTENGNATAWNIEYGPAGFEQGEGTLVAAPTNPFTVTGLDDATAYDFYVQASCGQDITSGWGEKATATTLCAPITVTADNPWIEGFEGYTGSGVQPFVCWETPVTYTASNGTFPTVYCDYATAAHSGNNSAEFKGTTNVLVLPEFTNNIYDLQVSFWANRTSTSYGSMEVGYITDLEDMTTFVAVGATPGPGTRSSGGTFMGTYIMPYSAPANARIALRYTSTSSTASWNLDDFTVSLAPTCRESSNLTASNVTTTSATISWTPGGLENSWTFQYMATSSDDWTTINPASSTVTLNNLAPSTDYLVRVRPTCADENMPWLNGQFTTECANAIPLVSVTIGEGTSTTNVAPANSNYKNSWTQMVYPASAFSSEVDIHTLSWYVNAANTHEFTSLKIYLGTKSSNINESTSDWVSMNDLTLVYETGNGTLGSQAGWETYNLSTPYHYNGVDNLVVVVSRTANNYKSVYYRYTSNTNTVLYRRSDSYADYAQHPGTNTGTRAANLPNMKINIDGLICNDVHCAAPENLAVSDLNSTSATLTWDAGDATAWRVGYRVAGATEWTSVDVANNTYTLTGLTSITNYEVRVKTLCSGDESEYVTANFTTTMVVEQLPYVTDFTTNDWMLNNGTCTNKWIMGTPSNKDYSALYISNDGQSAGYTNNSYSVVSAEKLFAMPAEDSVHVSFDVESGGESTWDFMKVFLAPSTVEFPAATSSTSSSEKDYATNAIDFSDYKSQTGNSTYPYMINLTQGNVIHIDMMVPNPVVNGQAKLVFVWRNDGSSGTQPGAIVSNLVVGTPSTCLTPTDLAATAVNADGASTITWTAGGEETAWTLTYAMEGEAPVSVDLTTPTYTLEGFTPGDSYEVSVVAVCGDDEVSAPATITVSMPALVDIALVNVYTNPSNCDLSNAIARIMVKNVREGSTISSFTASYSVNGGDVVTENVTLIAPLGYNQIATHVFQTAPVFTENANVITATVYAEGESNLSDNTMNSDITYLTVVKDIPYVENFSSLAAEQEWVAFDANSDGVNMAIANGAITYGGSDESAANDYMISPCLDVMDFNIHPYIISYDYKANSSYYDEHFSVYLNQNLTPDGNETLIAEHTFNNTEYVHVAERVSLGTQTITNSHLMFKAESGIGTEGFSIDNVALKEAVPTLVQFDENGSVDIISNDRVQFFSYPNMISYFLPNHEDATLVMTPNEGYHVAAIYRNSDSGWELVRGENLNNAAVDYYTFVAEPANSRLSLMYRVVFAPNTYTVNATVNNLYVTPYNNNAVGATYTPAHETVAHGGTHNGVITTQPYYHVEFVEVNGADYTSELVALGNGQYGLTLDPVMENKDILVVMHLDSAHITYTVNAGQGTINNTFVVDADATYPAVYTVTIPGYTNLLSTITPAPGYHVASILIDGIEYGNIEVYSFEHLLGDHTVEVTFAPNHYVITTNGVGNGTVSDGVEFDYAPDYTYTFTATPDEGYLIASITRNNIPMNIADPTASFTEVLTNIVDNYHYEVVFAPQTFSVTATAGANGTVSPAGVASYFYGQNAEYSITAALGYYIASVTVDGETTNYTQDDNMNAYTYTFGNINANHTISATFAQKTYTVTVNAGAHGAITPGTSNFAWGTVPTFTITPDAGYGIVDVTVDGQSVGAVTSYTFPALSANHTIAATFSAYQFTIAATAGNGGTISPAGNTSVAFNGTQNYTITANAGYHVSDVLVDGVSVGAVNTYSFTNVTADHAIYAAFELNQYTVTVNAPTHGTITPGSMTVQYGATPSFVITPDFGYNVTAITVNGTNVINSATNVNGVYTYTFPAIAANQTITATMTAKTYTINATAGANGTITPNGNTTVNHGASQTYTIVPANGYVVDEVTVDGMSMGAVYSYVFTNVMANHTINATFKMAECETPSFLYTTHIDSTSAMLHWSHPTATTFDLQYKTPTSNFTSIGNVSGNSYQMTDLTPNTTYMWQVRAHCTGNNISDWSGMVSFKTDNTTINNVGIDDLVKNNIKVYGEHQNVHILNEEGMNIEQVRIFDVYGKLIYTGNVTSNHEVIGLNVATGTYIVNVATDNGVANYKVTLMK